MGYAFTFHVVRWLSRGTVPIAAYVHYPTISTNMLQRVKSRTRSHTNDDAISSSKVLSAGKLLYVNCNFRRISKLTNRSVTKRYYRLFMYLYSSALRLACCLMVNSSWTKNHIDDILIHEEPLLDAAVTAIKLLAPISFLSIFGPRTPPPKAAKIVYPPCETQELVPFPLEGRQRIILSVAQFRYDFPISCDAISWIVDHYIDPRKIMKLRYSLSASYWPSIRNITPRRHQDRSNWS